MSSIKKKKGPLRLISKEASVLADGQSCPNSPAVKKTYRLVVVGSPRTGKSAILDRFLEKGFEDRYIPTIENFYRKLYKIKGDLYQLDIIDCSGNDPFPAARKLSYISGDMFVIVSSVDQAESIYQMMEIKQQIEDCKSSRGVTSSNPEVPCVFLLNKTDLPEYRWVVTSEEVAAQVEQEAGTSENLLHVSALNNTNIDKAFGRLFALAKCPKSMNPEIHKRLRNELSEDNQTSNTKRHLLQRMRSKFSRENDEPPISYTDTTARRPSLRTDLLMNRAKTSVVHQHLTHANSVGNNNNSEKANGKTLTHQQSISVPDPTPIQNSQNVPEKLPKSPKSPRTNSRCHLM